MINMNGEQVVGRISIMRHKIVAVQQYNLLVDTSTTNADNRFTDNV